MDHPLTSLQNIVVLERVSKIAEGWVRSMSGANDDKPCEEEIEGRPARLGLGAKFVPHSKVTSSNPVERKLQGKLDSEKKRVAKELEESNVVDEREEEDDLDSRANVFVKRRSFSTSDLESKMHMPGKKKRK